MKKWIITKSSWAKGFETIEPDFEVELFVDFKCPTCKTCLRVEKK